MNIIIDRQLALESGENEEPPSTQQLQSWVDAALQGANYQADEAEVTVRIVSPEESQALNHEYRQKDRPTNVLSFPFENPPGMTLPLLGDLVVCEAVVTEEAAQQHKSPEAHWAHMVVHGTLHLLGYDHINEAEAEEMETLEVQILSRLGYSNPYNSIEQ